MTLTAALADRSGELGGRRNSPPPFSSRVHLAQSSRCCRSRSLALERCDRSLQDKLLGLASSPLSSKREPTLGHVPTTRQPRATREFPLVFRSAGPRDAPERCLANEGRMLRSRYPKQAGSELSMLQRLETFEHLVLQAPDGDIGHVEDFRFDDQHWIIRYLIANTGTWFGRHVLISPIAIGDPDWVGRRLKVRLTREQIRNSPGARTLDLTIDPFTHELERAYMAYFRYTPYWMGERPWGTAETPQSLAVPAELPTEASGALQTRRGTLRSVRHLRGSHLFGLDGGIGHVDDVIVDENNWRMRYLLIDTRKWFVGRFVLLPTGIVAGADWGDRTLNVNTTKERIREAPRYDSAQPLDQTAAEAIDGYFRLNPAMSQTLSQTSGRDQ